MKAVMNTLQGSGSVFAQKLKEMMVEHGMTRHDDLADELGVSRQTISQYLQGITLPNIDTLHRLAVRFNISADYLIGLVEDKKLKAEDKVIHDEMGISGDIINLMRKTKIATLSSDATEATRAVVFLDFVNYFIKAISSSSIYMNVDRLKTIRRKVLMLKDSKDFRNPWELFITEGWTDGITFDKQGEIYFATPIKAAESMILNDIGEDLKVLIINYIQKEIDELSTALQQPILMPKAIKKKKVTNE